jgi:hypothetical protein
VAAVDFRISVFSPNAQTLEANDISGDVIALTYEDTPTGCGAGKLTLGIYLEDVDSDGYYEPFNLVEISSGDMRLATACAAGATKVYLDTTEPLDRTKGEDVQQLYFYDGTNLTMRVPVVSIGTDGGGVYANIGAPDGHLGNPSTLPAYGVGTIVGRRRYVGRVALVSSQETRDPNVTVTLVGLTVAWTQASGSVTATTSANVDVGTALYDVLVQFATSHWPFFAFSQANFPTVGYTYADTLTTVTMDRFIADALGAIPTADFWVVRVGHDRIPRLVQAYIASSNTYVYNRTLQQGVTNFEAQQVQIDGDAIANVYNAVTVTGSSSGPSGQPITVQVTDPASITALGFQIDGPPASNTAITTTAAASTYGAGLLAQNSLASATLKLLVWTNDDAPVALYTGGPIRGDVLRALACITVTNFDKTGIVTNSAPDSVIQYGTGVGALWTNTGGLTVIAGGAPDGQNAWSIPAGAGGGFAFGPTFACVPGQVWTFAGYIDASGVSGGGAYSNYAWAIGGYTAGSTTPVNLAYSDATTATGTSPATTFTVPAGYVGLCIYPVVVAHSGATGNVKFSQPNVCRGSFLRPYVQNAAAPNVYGLPTSIVTTIDVKTQTTKQEAQFAAIEPDWSSYQRLQQNQAVTALLANRSTPLSIDQYCVSANLRNYTTSTSTLGVTVPAFLAQFASGTPLVSVPAQSLIFQPSQTNYVFLEASGSSYAFVVQQSPTTIPNAIAIGYFTTSATGVIGSFFTAPVGVFQVGFGNVNSTTTLPAPTWSGTPSVTNGAAITGLATAVDASVALNNVPTNGSAAQILWLYRQSASAGGSGAWIPYEAQNLTLATGSVYPAASQTQTFEYDLNNGSTYDIAIAYVGLAGYGPLSIVQSGFVVSAIGIPNAYMLAGSGSAPAVTGTATPTGSNGLTAAMALAFTPTNQPTDGSLSRISIWYTTTAISGTWTYVGSFPAYGVGSASPPASHPYTFTVDSLANGTTYGFGISYENAQGGETAITQFATATAQAIAITVPYLIAGTKPTPTFSAASTISSAPALAGVALRVVLGWTINNQPTDGSLSQIAVYYRIHGSGNWSQAFAIPAAGLPNPTNPQSYANVEIPAMTAGVAYDFGIAYENAQGGQGNIAAPAAWSNYTPAPIAIANPYMLTTLWTPTISAVTITAAPTVTGGAGTVGSLSATASLAFTTTQPTDGSLSRISIYVAIAGSGNYGYVGSIVAQGASTSSPPASASYSGIQVPNLTNGTAYDFAIAMENVAGGEGAITYVGTSTAQAIAVTTQYLAGGTPVSPTNTSVTIASVPTLPGVVGRVQLSTTITNQPVDGTFKGVVFFQRQHGAGTGAWSVAFIVPTTSPATPAASGTYSVELPEVSAGVAFDFGVAFENVQGARGAIVSPAAWQNYTPQAIQIETAYLLGTIATPAVQSSPGPFTASVGTSNGLTAAVYVAFTLTNQPQDGSLSRIGMWQRVTAGGSNPWVYVGSFPSNGVNSTSPPASGTYTFQFDNLTNGQGYDFGCSYENAQGGEGTTVFIASATAVAIAVSTPYLLKNTNPATAPTISGTPTVASVSTLPGFAARAGVTFTVSNQPTDGSLSQIGCYYRNTGTNWSKAFAIPASPIVPPYSASQTYYFEIADISAGVAIDFGCTYEDAQGNETPVGTIATNYTPLAIGIASQYMLAGSTLTPVVSGPSATNGTSADGVNADVIVTFSLTNQPTDGSLSRVQIWVRQSSRGGSNVQGNSTFYWSPYGSQQAYGVGSSSPPASGPYRFDLADMTNGQTIDIGVSYENAQGGESTLAVVVSSFTTAALNLPASGTAFQNLLTDQFIGLAVNSTNGFLAMPVGSGIAIYPSTQSDYLGPYVGAPVDQAAIASYATFVMRFQLTSTSASGFITASMFTSATAPAGTFTSGYYITYTPGSPPTLTINKLVAGALYSIVSRSAAIAASGFYAAVPALPNSDLAFHELRVVIIPGSGLIVPAPGITIEIYLDSVLVLSFAESTTTAAVTTGPSYFSFGGNIGGVAPYTSGTCGPGSNGYSAVYLDPQDLVMTGTQGGRRYEQQQASLVKSQAKQAATGSTTPLETAVVQRESNAGTTGHGINLLFNPSAARGSNGWATYDSSGGVASLYTDQSSGGRFLINLPAHAYGAANKVAEWLQNLNTNAYNTLLASSTYTISGFLEVASLPTGAYAQISLTGLPTGSTSVGLTQFASPGVYFFSIQVTTGSGAFSSPALTLAVNTGTSATTTVAAFVAFHTLMLESGTVATHYDDSQAHALVANTHTATAGAEGSYLAGGLVSARHLYGGNAADAGAMVDSTSKLLFARHHAAVQAALTSTAGADASYLASGQISRRHVNPAGSANTIKNPRFQNGLAGWSFYSTASAGLIGAYATSAYFGGSASIVSGASRGATAYLDEIYQAVNANSFGYLSGAAVVAAVCVYIPVLYAGASVSLAWSDSSGGSGTLATSTATGTVLLSGTFTPTAGATTVNLLFQLTSAGNAASQVIFYDPKLELGSVATPFRDDNATSLLALTHEVELGSTGSFRSQTVQDRHIAASVPRKNLIVNGNNCAGTGDTAPSTFGWKGAYNTTAAPFSGGNYGPFLSIGFTKTSTASAQGYYQDVPVTPGQTYTFQGLIYDVSGSCSPTIWIGKSDYSTQYNASPTTPVNVATIPAFYSGAATHANANSTTSTAGWAHLYGTFAVPSGVSSVRVLIYDSGSVASLSFYAQGIMLTEGSRLQDYIDHEGNAGSIANRHLSNATQDGLANGTYTRSVWNLPHQGANLVENPYFAVTAQSPTTEVAANWAGLPTANIAYNGGSGWTMSQETTTGGSALIGSNDVLCRYNTGVTIPASTTYSNRITTERVFAALPGDSFVLNVHYSIASLASLPAGVQLNLHFGFYRYFSDGTNDVGAGAVGLVNLPNVSTATAGYATASTTYTVPQPVSKSVVGLTVTLEIEIQNTTGSSYTTTNLVADVRFGYVQCYRLTNLASEVTGQLPYANDSTATQAAISSAGALQGVNTAMIGPYGTTPGFSTINSSQTFTPSLTITIPSYGSWFVEIEWTARCTYTSLAIAATSTGTMGTPSSINAPNTTTVPTTGVAKYIVTATGAQTITATLTATTGNFTGAACATGLYITRLWRYA